MRLPGRLGRPDYAILDARRQVLVGHLELKQPGRGVVPEQFQGHDHDQWERFQALPNLIYSDGNQWALYRNGQRVGEVVSLHGDIRRQGARAVKAEDARRLLTLWTDFLSWQPVIPRREDGQVDQPALARLLAPLCRLLREEVLDALKEPDSPLNRLAQDWRELLFPRPTIRVLPTLTPKRSPSLCCWPGPKEPIRSRCEAPRTNWPKRTVCSLGPCKC